MLVGHESPPNLISRKTVTLLSIDDKQIIEYRYGAFLRETAMENCSRRRALGLMAASALGVAAPALAQSGIDETGFVRIGGIDQWIAIQGSNRRNPIILYLHGGPGEAQSPFLADFAPWEKDFTVVNWDQRGAGKTYEKNGQATPDVTMGRLADDAVEIAHYVLNKLGKQKLILVGQSFGSALGLMAARRAPELFYCFVGTAQIVSTPLTVEGWEAWTRQEARRRNDAEGLKALDAAAGLNILSRERMMAARKWIFGPADQSYIQRMAAFTGSPDHPNPEAAVWQAGVHFESSKLAPESFVFDAMKAAPDLPVPYVLIEGREDHVTPLAAAKAYFDTVRSLGKVFVPIDGGHFACFTNTDQFMAALRTHVLPLAR
jgi:pimeloyl-ACP methyl ester carboxylesterase